MEITERTIWSRCGSQYTLRSFAFDEGERGHLEEPAVREVVMALQPHLEAIFSYQDARYCALVLKKFDSYREFDLVLGEDGAVVSFHIYKAGNLRLGGEEIPALYIDHVGVIPELQGRGIAQEALKVAMARHRPRVVCVSSANPAFYFIARKMSQEVGFALFPDGNPVPGGVVRLAEAIHDDLDLHNATLDDRLVRTYPRGRTSKGHGEHPLAGSLQLAANQHVFYMLLDPRLCSTSRRSQF